MSKYQQVDLEDRRSFIFHQTLSLIQMPAHEMIPLGEMPHRFHSIEEVKIWHVRNVIKDSVNYTEAANRLGITAKSLYLWRDEYDIEEEPKRITI